MCASLSLTECCDCYTGRHMLLSGWEALSQYSNEGECWMYASHVIIGMFLLFLQAPKWKQVARRSQDRLENFVLALFRCAPYIYRTTALLGDSKWLCVHVRYVLCYCSKSISLLYRTTGDLKWLCVHVWYVLCYCSKSISLLYRTTRDLKWLCVHVRYVLCYCSKSISLLYRTTRDLKWLCVHVRYVLCYCSKSISLLYRMMTILYWQPDE